MVKQCDGDAVKQGGVYLDYEVIQILAIAFEMDLVRAGGSVGLRSLCQFEVEGIGTQERVQLPTLFILAGDLAASLAACSLWRSMGSPHMAAMPAGATMSGLLKPGV